MPAVTITPEDLAPFADIDQAKALAMIEDALAMAAQVAPCILDPTFTSAGAAKAVLRGAILRWNDSGSGALAAQTAGPFGVTMDTRTTRRSLFWPSEIESLQKMCSSNQAAGAFSVDTANVSGCLHSEVCSLMWGAAYCSCGADLTGGAGPLYENTGGQTVYNGWPSSGTSTPAEPVGAEYSFTNSASWTVTHDLSHDPGVTVIIDGQVVDADVYYAAGQVTVYFSEPQTGKLVLTI